MSLIQSRSRTRGLGFLINLSEGSVRWTGTGVQAVKFKRTIHGIEHERGNVWFWNGTRTGWDSECPCDWRTVDWVTCASETNCPHVVEELTGWDFLRSLPIGTRILSSISKERIVIVDEGIYWVDDNRSWVWDDDGCWGYMEWVKKASHRTCPTWEPSND